MHLPLGLRCQREALVGNYLKLQARSGTAAGAAVKADGYGLGAEIVAKILLETGCRDFFVSNWSEALALPQLREGMLAVLHGLGAEDEPIPGVRAVLVSTEQVARWKNSRWTEQPCDVMIDTGMHRLGLSPDEIASLDGLNIHTLHSHLACADEDHVLNDRQLQLFRSLRSEVAAERYSLANSAGIYLGTDYSFDLVRPGLALYGGVPCSSARGEIRQVATPWAQVIQIRSVPRGSSIGYNATFVAPTEMRIAVINVGYADGYRRAFSDVGSATFQDFRLPVVGRVSMDLVTLDAGEAEALREGDWVALDFNLEDAAQRTGISQYELLTGLGSRFQRSWF